MSERFQHAPCGYISLNQNCFIVEVNTTFLNWTGFSGEIVGMHFDEILTVANKIMIHTYFYPTIKLQGAVDEFFINFKHASGQSMPYLLNARLFGEGDEARIDCMFMQMKKRIDYELELRSAKEKLSEAFVEQDLAYKQLTQINAEIKQKQSVLMAMNEALVTVTNTDKLTGIANRKYFHEKLDEHMKLFSQQKTPLSLLIIDIDYFKKVNDTFGHLMGDQVLIGLSSILSEQARAEDVVCRYGGEEFMVILPNTNAEMATEIATQYNQMVHEEKWPDIGKLSISLGVATLASNENEEDFIKHADEALYSSKHKGRNQVTHYNEISVDR